RSGNTPRSRRARERTTREKARGRRRAATSRAGPYPATRPRDNRFRALQRHAHRSKESLVQEGKPKLRYHRVVIKLSGEALCGKEGGFGIDTETLKNTAAELGELHETGVQ